MSRGNTTPRWGTHPASCHVMAFWLKAGLWVAAIVLPGGLLLLPVIYAVHRRDERIASVTPRVTCDATPEA